MFLKNKWSRLSIKNKIFISTGAVIMGAFFILYLLMYAFMPRVFNIYKTHVLKSNTHELIKTLEKDSDIDIEEEFVKFALENNASFIVEDMKGNNIIKSKEFNRPFTTQKNFMGHGVINVKEEFYFKAFNQKCTIEVMGNFKPIDEATKALVLFIPFMIIISIILALFLGNVYSKLITKPILDINSYAKRVAELDFKSKLLVKGEDEIGELCRNLNNMSENLESNIRSLEAANEKLHEDIERERKIEKERRDFIATISHELKSPLTIINGQLEGMIFNIGKYKERDKYLNESLSVVQGMKELVNEILSVSRIENDSFKLKIADIPLTELIEQICHENKYFILNRNIKLNLDVEEEVWIQGDQALLKVAFTNIIVNAFKYTPEGGSIDVSLNEERLMVENIGVRLSDEDLSNLFKAFYRVDKSRNRQSGGSGLGLYIVKTIFDKHKNIEYNMYSKENSIVFESKFKW